MEQDQEHKSHLCMLCNLNFGGGKSLGDHMRVHGSNKSSKMGFQFSHQKSYVLRDNPKKSWRFSDSNNGGSRTEYQCKVHGHVRHHSRSERDKIYCIDCDKGFGSIKSIYAKQSEVEFGSGFSSAKRPRTKRYKVSSNCFISDSCTFDSEDEEVAEILLMLSKGVRTWGEIGSINARFLGGEIRGINTDEGSPDDGDALLGEELTQFGDLDSGFSSNNEKKALNLENGGDSGEVDVLLGETVSQFGNLDSGVLNTDERKMELEGSIEKLFKNNELKNPNLENELKNPNFENELKNPNLKNELKNPNLENELKNPNLKNRFLEEQVNCTYNIALIDAEKCCKKVEYKCRTCFKVFRSHQALGGHRTRQCLPKNTAGDSLLVCQDTTSLYCKNVLVPVDHVVVEPFLMSCDVNKSKLHACAVCMNGFSSGQGNCSSDIELIDAEKYCKKVEYKCRTCFKVFRSSQALGGHRARQCVAKNTAGDSLLDCEATTIMQCKNLSVPVDDEMVEPFVISCEINKSKKHSCAICMKCFASGQALGGHMRAHYVHSDDHIFVDGDILDNKVEDKVFSSIFSS